MVGTNPIRLQAERAAATAARTSAIVAATGGSMQSFPWPRAASLWLKRLSHKLAARGYENSPFPARRNGPTEQLFQIRPRLRRPEVQLRRDPQNRFARRHVVGVVHHDLQL